MKKIILSLLSLPLMLTAADIYMAGDSTMQEYDQKKYAPMEGWGAKMQNLCIPGVTVHNRARGGRSAKSFITEKRWEKIMDDAKKGDFVIIQFGINDNASGDKNFYRHTEANGTYRDYLRIYIAEARAKGLTPVLATQTVFCHYGKDGKFYRGDRTLRYVNACRKVAEETGCDLIDLNEYAAEKFSKLAHTEAEKFYMCLKPGESPNYPKGKRDTCHLKASGAEFYAKAFVELAKKQNLPIAKLFK